MWDDELKPGTVATKLNSTRGRLWKSTKSTVPRRRTHWRQSRKDVRHSADRVDRIGNKVDRIGNKVDRVGDKVDRAKAPYTLATKSKGHSTFGRQSRPYWQQSRPSWRQCRPRRAIEFKLLPICRQNRQQSRPYRLQSTLLPIRRRFRQQATLSAVCTGLNHCINVSTCTLQFRVSILTIIKKLICTKYATINEMWTFVDESGVRL